MLIFDYILATFDWLFLVYAGSVFLSYIALIILSGIETINYFRKNSFVNYKDILSSPMAPSISIIAPAYNEGLNIVDNVRSLLSSHYVNYEVIIVNDGSKDDSMERLIAAYDLEKVNYLIDYQIPTQKVRGIYKSKNPAFEKLMIVDKENGGKADALNTGLNISNNRYVACIDVDCLLVEDSLQKMIKPFMEFTDKKVIATGGVIRIANSCEIKDGKLIKVNLPKKLIERAQILEYIRAFLLGRMAWSRLNGLLVISGAFGIFDRKVAIDAGGYDTNTVGEDMEIIVRMRKFMQDQNLPYKVAYIPDPLCWTEAPDNYKILTSQRNRWARGTIETLKMHKDICFNPKYKSFGMLSYPFWLIYERMAPLIEVAGILYFVVLISIGKVHVGFALAFFVAAYLFSVLFSIVALLTEDLTYHQYKKKEDIFKLVLTALLEPFVFHPFMLWAGVKGNIDKMTGKKIGWGTMTRKGLGSGD